LMTPAVETLRKLVADPHSRATPTPLPVVPVSFTIGPVATPDVDWIWLNIDRSRAFAGRAVLATNSCLLPPLKT